MRVSGYLSCSGAALLKKYQIGEAMADAGVPVEIPTLANTDGVLLVETTTAILGIGITQDAQATRNTAQQSDNSDPAVYVTVDVRPDAIIQGRLCGGATSGTALTAQSNTVADTTGLLITTSANNSAYDDGVAWGADGGNAGILRKITAVTTTAVPIVAYPIDLAVGDQFFFCTFGPSEDAGVVLTSDLTEINATSDGQSNDNFRCIDFEQRPLGEDGDDKSYAYLVWFDHLYGACSPST